MKAFGRITIATPLYPPELGGPATYAKVLEEELPKQGIEADLVKFSAVKKLPPIIRHLLYMVKVFGKARKAGVVLALDPVSVGLPAALAASFARRPLVVKIVGDYAWEQGTQRYGVHERLDVFVHEHQRVWQVRMLQRIQKWVATKAAVIIVPSHYLKRVVSAWGIAPEKIHVVYNAKPEAVAAEIPVRAQLAHPRIVTVGRLVPWKGIGGIISALVEVRKKLPESTLTIIGEGPDRKDLEAYAKARLIEGYSFTGALTHAETLAVIQEADVFVLNSTYEGLSHVLIEALAAGVPIVATNAGGNSEVVEQGKDGLLIPVGDHEALAEAVMALLSDTKNTDALRAYAKESAKRFSRDAMIEGTIAVLRGVA